jgi:hypothetical protein
MKDKPSYRVLANPIQYMGWLGIVVGWHLPLLKLDTSLPIEAQLAL